MRRTLLIVAALAMLSTACTAAGAQTATTPSTAELAARLATAEATIAVMQRQIAAGDSAAVAMAQALTDGQHRDASLGASLIALRDSLGDRIDALEARHRVEALRHQDRDRIGWPLNFRDGRVVRVGPVRVERGENFTTYELREPLAETLTMNLATSNGEILTPSVLTWAAGETGYRTAYVTLPDGFETTWPTSQRYWPLHIAPTVTLGADTVRALDHWIRLTRD